VKLIPEGVGACPVAGVAGLGPFVEQPLNIGWEGVRRHRRKYWRG
jgi:hypothetical protein